MPDRPKIYLETSVISYLVARPSPDPEKAAKQAYTLRWKNKFADQYELYVSELVYKEAEQGDSEAAARRIEEIRKYKVVSADEDEVDALSLELRKRHQIFETAIADSTHIAISAVAGFDVLLTWNCRHMANLVALPKTVQIVTLCGYRCPQILTPRDFFTHWEEE